MQFDLVAPKIPDSTIERIRTLADATEGGGVHVALGGRMFQEFSGPGPAELIGILAAIVILLVAFGSLLAMGLPILIALFGIGIGLGFVELLSHVIATPDFATQLASMIGIGVGIDYALLIVTRYRQGLGEGLDPEHAVVRAIDTAGRAVVFAGCTVFISLLGLFLMGVDFVNGMAVGTSVTVGIVMLASITLLPALLGFAGRTIDRFSVRRTRVEKPREQSLWFRWSRVVQRRPWPAFVGGLVILVVLAIPLLSMRLAFPDAGGNPTTDTTRQAYDLVADGFGAGFNGPLMLAAVFPEGADTRPLDALVAQLRSMPDVAAATAPTLSPSGDAAVIRAIPASSPQSVSTTDLVDTLRDDVIPASVAGSDVQVHVGGLTASSIDVSDRLASRLPIFIGAVLVLSFLLLMAVFRSLLVPLKAVIMNLLSIGAAYGVVVAVFEWGWLSGVLGVEQTGPIAPFVPMMMFAILFGLSMDYEVFLLSRIREEYDRTGDNADGGGRRTRLDRAGHHRRGPHHGDGLRELRPRRRHHDQALRPRARHRHPGRRHRRPHGAGAGGDGTTRRPQLVVPGLARPHHPAPARRSAAPTSTPSSPGSPRRKASRSPAPEARSATPPASSQPYRSEPPMTTSPALDHIALTVPNLDDLVERLTTAFGMVAQLRSEHFAVVVDPGSDFKLELSTSDDGEVHLRHLGFRSDDVDAAHASLVAAGMETSAAPHRQDFARMYTSFLKQPGGVEVQLVKYD